MRSPREFFEVTLNSILDRRDLRKFGKITALLREPLRMRKRHSVEQIAQALRQAQALGRSALVG